MSEAEATPSGPATQADALATLAHTYDWPLHVKYTEIDVGDGEPQTYLLARARPTHTYGDYDESQDSPDSSSIRVSLSKPISC